MSDKQAAANRGTTINFDRTMALRLKARYQQAVKADEAEFTFEGNPLLTSYAKYLVEYLAGKFGFPKD